MFPDIEEAGALHVIRRGKPHRLVARFIFFTFEIGAVGMTHQAGGVFLTPTQIVRIFNATVGTNIVVFYGVNRGVMAAPAKCDISRQLNAVLRVGEGVAANPGLARRRGNHVIIGI